MNHFKKKYDVHLITYGRYVPEDVITYILNSHKRYRPLNKFLMPLHLLKIKKLIEKIRPSIIHGHYLTSHGAYAALSDFHPVINSAWGSDVLIERFRFPSRELLKVVVKKSDLIIGGSNWIKNHLINFGCQRNKIVVIPYGVNIKTFRKYHTKPEDILNFHNISQDDRIIISTRNLAPIYNIECLIKAVPLILDKIPNAKIILLGQGPSKLKLETMAKNLGVESAVRFVGTVKHEEVSKYLNLADIYVSTSLSDSPSVSLLEAMACELPVVISDVPAYREWVRDGEGGLFFERHNYKELAANFVRLSEDENLRKEMGQKNRQVILRRAVWEKNMEQAEKLYYAVKKHTQTPRLF